MSDGRSLGPCTRPPFPSAPTWVCPQRLRSPLPILKEMPPSFPYHRLSSCSLVTGGSSSLALLLSFSISHQASLLCDFKASSNCTLTDITLPPASPCLPPASSLPSSLLELQEMHSLHTASSPAQPLSQSAFPLKRSF